VCYKLLERLALQRISPTVEGLLSPDQAGFQKGRSICDQVAALTTFIENGFQQKLKTGAVFLDWSSSRCIRRRPPASAICRYWSSTGFTRSDRHWAAEFRRQRTYHLEQSATSTTFAGSVAEHLQAGTEDASLLIRPATLSHFETLPLLINLPTYLLTYKLSKSMPY